MGHTPWQLPDNHVKLCAQLRNVAVIVVACLVEEEGGFGGFYLSNFFLCSVRARSASESAGPAAFNFNLPYIFMWAAA